MKKLMTAFAACLIVGVAAAEIVSQNIVGYNTATVPANQQIIVGSSFQAVGGGALTFDQLTGGATFNDGDYLYVWDGSSYGQGYTWDGGEGVWYDIAADDVGTPELPAGTGAWVISNTENMFTFSGEVLPSPQSLVYPAGQSLTACPVPVGLELMGANVTWDGVSDGDYIYVWDGTSYGQGFTWDGGEGVWYDIAADDVASGVNVPVGAGFWIINSAQVTLTVAY